MQADPDQIESPTGEQPVHVTVSFSARSGPVSGTVSMLDGEQSPFHGWLELMDALERLRGPLNLQRPA